MVENQNPKSIESHLFNHLFNIPLIDCSFHTNNEQLTGKVLPNVKWVSELRQHVVFNIDEHYHLFLWLL